MDRTACPTEGADGLGLHATCSPVTTFDMFVLSVSQEMHPS